MKSIRDNYVYSFLNNQNGLDEKILNAIKNSQFFTFNDDELHDAYRVIKKYKYSTTDNIIKAVNSGAIKIMYYDNTIFKLPMPISFFVLDEGGSNVAYVNASNICKGKIETVEIRKLFSLLEGALLNLKLLEKEDVLSTRAVIHTKGVITCYVKLFSNILNMDHAISVNGMVKAKIEFIIAKFCLINVFGMRMTNNEDKINRIALASINSNVGYELVEETDIKFEEADYLDLHRFFDVLTDGIVFPILKNYNLRRFITSWANNYSSSAMMSIEYLPYLLFMLTSVLRASDIVSQYKVEPHVVDSEKEIEELIFYLLR